MVELMENVTKCNKQKVLYVDNSVLLIIGYVLKVMFKDKTKLFYRSFLIYIYTNSLCFFSFTQIFFTFQQGQKYSNCAFSCMCC